MTKHFVLALPDNFILTNSTSEQEVISAFPETKIMSSEHDEFKRYLLPNFQFGNKLLGLVLCYDKSKLSFLDIFDLSKNFGTSWNDWSEQKELARAESVREWLHSAELSPGPHQWGTIWCGIDTKGGMGYAKINLLVA